MKYQPPVGGGANDPYANGDRSTGTEGSIPPAEAIEHPQREIVHVLQQMGLTPDETDLTQLYEAMNRAAGRKVTTVTAADSPKALTVAEAGLVLVDASAGPVVLNLPVAASNAGLGYALARVDSIGANAVTVQPDGAAPDTIDGAASLSLTPGRAAAIQSGGADRWYYETRPEATEPMRAVVADADAAPIGQSFVDHSTANTPFSGALSANGVLETFAPEPTGNRVQRLVVNSWSGGSARPAGTQFVRTFDGSTWSGWAVVWWQNEAGSSFAASGYQMLPSGLIFQWGRTTIGTSGTEVTFPVAFPNACLGVISNYGGGSGAGVTENSDSSTYVGDLSSSGFVGRHVLNGSAAATSFFDWFAIGY